MKTLAWLATLLLASGAAENTTFDTSVDGQTPAGWFAARSWKVTRDSTAPTPPYVLAHDPAESNINGFATAVLNAPDCRDGDVSVKFKPGGKADGKAGLVWRYRDARNYYFARADAEEQNVVAYRVAEGKIVPLTPRGRPAGQYSVRHYVHPDSWSLLKVEFKGRRFSVYYDHRRILEVDDAALSTGRVGVWTRGFSAARFDNFQLVRRR